MSLFEKLRAEFIDIIEWVDDSRHTLVWRFPRYHNQIKNGAQLVVRPGQLAIFVREGKLADVFEPGHYTLTTQNLPILSTLAGWKYAFDSPFMAEVYFVNTREIVDLKWGTPHEIMLRDPDFGPVRVRAFGLYTLHAGDPRTLLEQLVGTDSSFEMDEITELLRTLINQSFADVLGKSEVAVLDLAGNYQSFAELVRAEVIEKIDDEYGLEMRQLTVVNISLPPEVEAALDLRTRMSLIGNMAEYQAYQMANAMPVAAANEAGGLAGAGIGLGMGMGMAGHLMPNIGIGQAVGGPGTAGPGPAPGPQAPPPPPVPPSFHLVQNGQTVGPFNLTQLAQAVGQGQLTAETLVWTAGMQGWVAAREAPALAAFFAVPPPPPAAQS